jgi:ABC-type dipeptide/oligopeptide/nickel transport system ATPase component
MNLTLENLTVAFQREVVVNIDAFSCSSGEIVGLVGESGSGKSITAAAILGLARRLGATVTGSIRIDRQEVTSASERELRELRGRRVAMIFQDPAGAFSPVMRVGEVVTRALRLHKGCSRRGAAELANATLKDMFLPADALRRYPHQLSGGQLQRIAIALALALDVEILIADEPTTALDVTIQAEILDLMQGLRANRGLGILLITHDLAVISEVADRVAVMRAGKIVETGPVAETLVHPRHPYTRALLEAVPRLSASSRAGPATC